MNIPESEKQFLADFKFPILELSEWKKFGNPHAGYFVENGHITTLTLQGLKLTVLPKSIGNLKELRLLLLSDNLLKNLPKSFQNLLNLETLILGNNNFTYLPDWFGNLINLKKLQLGSNCFFSVPDCLENLRSLCDLSLRDNKLNSLPDWFGNLTNLESILLGSNNISILPESFRYLKNLKYLDLSATGLRSFSNIPNELIDRTDPLEDSWPWTCFKKGNFPSIQAEKIIDYNLYSFRKYYRVSPLILAAKYAKDQDSLTLEEKNRLAWEGGFRERDVIEIGGINLDDPILAEINNRLTVTFDNGLKLIK